MTDPATKIIRQDFTSFPDTVRWSGLLIDPLQRDQNLRLRNDSPKRALLACNFFWHKPDNTGLSLCMQDVQRVGEGIAPWRKSTFFFVASTDENSCPCIKKIIPIMSVAANETTHPFSKKYSIPHYDKLVLSTVNFLNLFPENLSIKFPPPCHEKFSIYKNISYKNWTTLYKTQIY